MKNGVDVGVLALAVLFGVTLARRRLRLRRSKIVVGVVVGIRREVSEIGLVWSPDIEVVDTDGTRKTLKSAFGATRKKWKIGQAVEVAVDPVDGRAELHTLAIDRIYVTAILIALFVYFQGS